MSNHGNADEYAAHARGLTIAEFYALADREEENAEFNAIVPDWQERLAEHDAREDGEPEDDTDPETDWVQAWEAWTEDTYATL